MFETEPNQTHSESEQNPTFFSKTEPKPNRDFKKSLPYIPSENNTLPVVAGSRWSEKGSDSRRSCDLEDRLSYRKRDGYNEVTESNVVVARFRKWRDFGMRRWGVRQIWSQGCWVGCTERGVGKFCCRVIWWTKELRGGAVFHLRKSGDLKKEMKWADC